MTSTFYGRAAELAWLRRQFDLVAARGEDGLCSGPRMAVVVAETGYGKSRLVQELYLQLTSDPLWDPAESDYWPDAFRGAGSQLRVNPDMAGHAPKGPPRFMWLGVRWQPPDDRNSDLRPVLPDLKSELSIHLRIVERHREVWERLLEAQRKALGTKGLKKGALEALGGRCREGGGVARHPVRGSRSEASGRGEGCCAGAHARSPHARLAARGSDLGVNAALNRA
jgi:hypothetical protein